MNAHSESIDKKKKKMTKFDDLFNFVNAKLNMERTEYNRFIGRMLRLSNDRSKVTKFTSGNEAEKTKLSYYLVDEWYKWNKTMLEIKWYAKIRTAPDKDMLERYWMYKARAGKLNEWELRCARLMQLIQFYFSERLKDTSVALIEGKYDNDSDDDDIAVPSTSTSPLFNQ